MISLNEEKGSGLDNLVTIVSSTMDLTYNISFSSSHCLTLLFSAWIMQFDIAYGNNTGIRIFCGYFTLAIFID